MVLSLSLAAALVALSSSGSGEDSVDLSMDPGAPRFTVLENYTGTDFFDGFMFFSDQADPTAGYVNYVDHDTAFKNGLAAVTADGAVLLRGHRCMLPKLI